MMALHLEVIHPEHLALMMTACFLSEPFSESNTRYLGEVLVGVKFLFTQPSVR